LYLDFETYSEVDLRRAGLYRYVDACEPLLVGWAEDDGPVSVEELRAGCVPDVLVWAASERATLVAHNAQFERLVLRRLGVDVPPERWICTASLARSLGLPGGLDAVEAALGRPEDARKLADGRRLIQLFCAPHTPTKRHPYRTYGPGTHPADWARFCAYCAQDVESCRWLHQHLPAWNQAPSERRVYALDQRVNDRGLPLDMPAVEALHALTLEIAEAMHQEVQAATGGAVRRATEVAQLRAWIAAEHDLDLPNLRRDTVHRALADAGLPREVRALLRARLAGGKAASRKYRAMLDTETGGRLRGAYVYAGAARTMRWSSRYVQTQNLYRPTLDPGVAVEAVLSGVDLDLLYPSRAELAASAVRGVVRASEGARLVVGDFAQIEARIVAWLAGETLALERFATAGVDPYVEAARDVGSRSRTLGKVLTLACGFGMGAERFRETARGYGLTLSEDEATAAVKAWRKANPAIVALWYRTEEAARAALASPGKRYRYGKIAWELEEAPEIGRFLTGRLPSGHRLCYYDPQVEDDRLTYAGPHPVSHAWGRRETWGGTLVENAVQASARHLLAEAMLRLPPALEVVGHTHDEVIAETRTDPEEMLGELLRCLRKTPDWADGLPVDAAGYVTERYRK
jgi:DNA polymerase